MPLRPYTIRFRKKRGGTVHKWTRFAHNKMEARSSAKRAIVREYGDDAVFLTITKDKYPSKLRR